MDSSRDFRPNSVEKTLGCTSSLLFTPFLGLTLPFVGLLVWTASNSEASRPVKIARLVLRPAAALLLFLAFLLILVVAIPYYLLLAPLLALGIVRMPPPEEVAEDVVVDDTTEEPQ